MTNGQWLLWRPGPRAVSIELGVRSGACCGPLSMLPRSVPTRCLFPRFAVLVMFWLSLGAAVAARLPVEFSIRRWSATERLPLSSVEAMVQTRDGFIWFAMNGGLGRFDGENLRVFDAANTPELPVPVITALAEAPDGSLWIGSAGGGLVRWDAGRFQRFGLADGLLNEQVKALSLGGDGRLWIGTDGGGVFVRNPDGRIRNYGPTEGLEDPYVVGLKMDVSGKLIVATFREGPWVLIGERFRRLELNPAPANRADLSLTQAESGRVWLGTSGGVYAFEGERFERWAPGDSLGGATALTAWEVSTNEVWIGTDRNLIRWKHGDWTAYPTGGATAPRMANSFLIDHEGSVWLSVEGGGLLQLRPTPVAVLGAAEGLAGNEVTSVCEARDGALWIGTTHGLTRHGPEGSRLFTREDGLPDLCVFSVQEDAADSMWVSTRRGGVVRWLGGRFVPVAGSGGKSPDVGWCVVRGRGQGMWVGTPHGLLEYQDGRFVRQIAGDQGLSNNDVRCVVEQADGVLWVGTSYGLNRISASGVQVFTVTERNEPLDVVISLHLDGEGALWIGTMARGLFRLQDGELHRYSTADGLPDNAINSIMEDPENQLWLATGNGLAVVSRHELVARQLQPELPLNLRVYRRSDGLRSEEMTGTIQPTAARTADGRLWFCTANGLASFAPKAAAPRISMPRVSLERVAMEGLT